MKDMPRPRVKTMKPWEVDAYFWSAINSEWHDDEQSELYVNEAAWQDTLSQESEQDTISEIDASVEYNDAAYGGDTLVDPDEQDG